MSTFQKVIIMGYLGQDPETKVFDNGGSVTVFSVATTERWKDKDGEKKERTDWHNIIVRNKSGETVAKYFKKGSRILIEGKLQTRSYEDANGVKKYITEVVALSWSFVDSAAQSETNTGAPAPGPGDGGDDLPF